VRGGDLRIFGGRSGVLERGVLVEGAMVIYLLLLLIVVLVRTVIVCLGLAVVVIMLV